MLSMVYPDHQWLPWRFKYVPKGIWREPNNRKEFIEWCADQLGITSLDQWYKINSTEFAEKCGSSMFNYYSRSYFGMLKDMYPQHEWDEDLFAIKPRTVRYMKALKSPRTFTIKLAQKYNLKQFEGWYQLKKQSFVSSGLFQKNQTMYEFLQQHFPEHEWLPFCFPVVPIRFWKDPEICRKWVKYLEDILDIKDLSDWKHVSRMTMEKYHGDRPLKKYGGKLAILAMVYPEHQFQSTKLNATQKHLFDIVEKYFHGQKVLMEARPKELKFQGSKWPLQLDIYLPDLRLAFEYQGEQHFRVNQMYKRQQLDVQQQKDEEKRKICKENNITLIEVPYWWNRGTNR